MFTLQLAGYSSCEDVIAGFSVPVEDRAQITSGSWIACVTVPTWRVTLPW